MSEPSDAVLAYWSEHRQQLRQSETQRSVLTNFLLVITAGLSGLIVQQKFTGGTLPLALLILGIGLYGALSAAKYHERAEYHLSQARTLTRVLTDLGALPDNRTELDAARQAHYGRFRLLHRLRLHTLWTGLHIGIALYGVALLVVTVVR
jgi:hypothetical protein